MGRTQPSFTAVVDRELNKLERVSLRLEDERLRARVQALRRRVRDIEGALGDEPTDPLEIVLIASLMDDRNQPSASSEGRVSEPNCMNRCGLACGPWGAEELAAEANASVNSTARQGSGNRSLLLQGSSSVIEAGTSEWRRGCQRS